MLIYWYNDRKRKEKKEKERKPKYLVRGTVKRIIVYPLME